MKVGIGADVSFASVEFNLNSAVAAAGSLVSVSEWNRAEEALGEVSETADSIFIV